MLFQEKLEAASSKNNSLLCVALDPESSVTDIFAFNKKIIDDTKDFVCAYKPNSAFYEAKGEVGIAALKKTVDYIHEVAPDLPVILDAKRGDIGNSNYSYAAFAFDYLGVDALTLHPYMGGTSLIPFFERKEKGFFILCKTSNKGAGEFQDLTVDGVPLYQQIAKQAMKSWNYNENVMFVCGATYPDALKSIRDIVGETTILVPGIGAQGGDLEAMLKAGLTTSGKGIIVAVGRQILTAENPKEEAENIKNQVNEVRKQKTEDGGQKI